MRSRGINQKSDLWHFQFFYLIEVLRCTFCWKPCLNWSSGSKVISNWMILRTIENNRNSFLFWLCLTINTLDFWLIPLDRNTYVIWYMIQFIWSTNDRHLRQWLLNVWIFPKLISVTRLLVIAGYPCLDINHLLNRFSTLTYDSTQIICIL